MFENILGQEGAVLELKADIEKERLPASLLFYGPVLSGKLTTALELARVLMCVEKTAQWNCNCPSCEQNRLLENPYLLLLGAGNFVDEIRVASDVLRRTDSKATRYLLIRAVRKLLKRYDGALWEGAENRISALAETLSDLEESVSSFLPGQTGAAGGELEKRLERIVDLSESIAARNLTDVIPVHQVRKVSYWTHTTTGGSPKVVIFENADRMLPGSANALLKILEEPPADTHFVLITTKKEAIIPTLKSRLRQFQFRERPKEVQEDILRRVFRENSGEYGSLERYFRARSANPEVVQRACERFLDSIQAGSPDVFFAGDAGDATYLKHLEDGKVFRSFLIELSSRLRVIYLESVKRGEGQRRIKRFVDWNNALAKQALRLDSFNMNVPLLLHGLYRDMARKS
ncbi:MAG: hypothetical protein JW852_04165 [Spirochaetales bacterium]|nr:hypothetical protein [Spirochaetales bacterium]